MTSYYRRWHLNTVVEQVFKDAKEEKRAKERAEQQKRWKKEHQDRGLADAATN
jgi:hypothetical protein